MDDTLESRVRRLEDLHDLQQLRARYCQLLDDGRWAELAELFTEDGAFVGLSTARGRADLVEFFSGLAAGGLTAWWHFSANETIDLDGDAATGATWLYQPCVVDGEAHVAAGRYTDRMVRCADGRWRFTERKVSFFWWVPADQAWDRGTFGYGAARAAADTGYAG
ncbi:nuclear transport factor 2 family protein [Cumulibacter manganitolerans]|uniref:nuclear transport factor 2 family protein n=1 Tax=Cumulibacter manganitolerans TaxID=1884992 RepID=UPI001297DD79|nr:nuclear transport factor 2 family protein [Cumulibacter manganitolerans]